MLGEAIDRLLTYVTGGVVFWPQIKSLFGSALKNPEITKIATEKLIEVAKGGRTRSDELLFIASLITLEDVSSTNKELFLAKHYELCQPNLTGKTPEEIKELKQKEKLAKGLIFLIAEDKTATDENPAKRFQYAKEIWYGIFLDIDSFPDDKAKLQVLEQRILHFGRNHQERMTISEIAEKIRPYLQKADESAQSIGNAIFKFTNYINRQYDEREMRREDRRQMTWAQRLRPGNIWRWFNDQF